MAGAAAAIEARRAHVADLRDQEKQILKLAADRQAKRKQAMMRPCMTKSFKRFIQQAAEQYMGAASGGAADWGCGEASPEAEASGWRGTRAAVCAGRRRCQPAGRAVGPQA